MTEELTKPLIEKQIKAATEMYEKLEYWKRKNSVLDSLNERDAEFSDEYAILLKVAAINQFYYTNLWAIDGMTDHLKKLSSAGKLSKSLLNTDSIEIKASLVEHIAALEIFAPEDPDQISTLDSEKDMLEDTSKKGDLKEQEKQKVFRRHTSFASKFAYFFISKKDFPIYDTYAENTLAFHLHWQKRVREKDHLYISYYKNVERLLKWAPLSCSFEELDRYLWLTGLYKAWRKQQADDNQKTGKKQIKINKEVARQFDALTIDEVPQYPLNEMLPPEYYQKN